MANRKRSSNEKPAAPASPTESSGELSGYLAETRGVALSLLFIAPLLVFYEVGLAVMKPQTRSYAGRLLRQPFHNLLGSQAMLGFNVLIFAALLVAFWRLNRHQKVRARYYPFLLLESGVYGFFFGAAAVAVLGWMGMELAFAGASLPTGDLAGSVLLSVGAGVYEEIIFRLLLLAGLYHLCTKLLLMGQVPAAAIAVVLSSFAFAACHYIQLDVWDGFRLSWTQDPTWQGFSFRFVSGGIFSLIFLTRGLAVAAYTHAFHDIFVTLR